MLVLQRRQYQSIRIGEDVFVTVLLSGREYVKLGIEAPANVNIVRSELIERDLGPEGERGAQREGDAEGDGP